MNTGRFDRGWYGLIAFAIVGVIGLVWTYDYEPVVMGQRLQGPSLSHPLGTDWLGRDLMRRLLAGTRGFFLPGLLAVLVCGVLGVTLGAIAGYSPPQDALRPRSTWRVRFVAGVQSVVGVVLALPGALPRMVSLVLLCAAFGFDAYLLALGTAVIYAGELGEDVRQRVRRCCQEEYVESAVAAGIHDARILGYHILWLHVRPLVARHLLQLWAFVILVESTLSFMPGGFGVQEPDPSWGNMLQGSQEASLSGDVWAAAVVTCALVMTVVLLAWVGDRLAAEVERGGSA